MRGLTEPQVAVLKARFASTSNDELTRLLGCKLCTVKNIARKHGLRKSDEYINAGGTGRKPFTDEEKATIARLFADTPTATIAAQLGRTTLSIGRYANDRGMKKSAAFLASDLSGRLRPGTTLGSARWFKPGAVSPNKGKRMPEHVREKVKRTFFKKGNVPHNVTHDGCITLRSDGDGRQYFWIRLGPKKHQHLHRYLWEQKYGAVPAGHVITFKDGNRGNCVIENLECVTEAERMSRTTIMNYPKEIRDSIRILARLNKLIQNHGAEQNG